MPEADILTVPTTGSAWIETIHRDLKGKHTAETGSTLRHESGEMSMRSDLTSPKLLRPQHFRHPWRDAGTQSGVMH